MAVIVPPGGFAGFAQMAPASQRALTRMSPMERSVRRSSRRQGVKTTTRRRKRKAKSGGRKMKFGSPAWQKKYKVGKYRKGR